MNDEYVSFETARLLKEKGFNEPTERYFTTECGDIVLRHWKVGPWRNENNDDEEYVAPTQALAMRWLREQHSIFIQSEPECLPDTVMFMPKVYEDWVIEHVLPTEETYEEAVEKGLRYALKELL